MRKAPVALIAVVLGACTGSIEEGESSRSSGVNGQGPPSGRGVGGGATPSASACSAVLDGGLAPVRRLTREEYASTVRDLLGWQDDSAAAFVADGVVAGFRNNAGAPVTVTIAQDYMDAAERLAAKAVTRLDVLLPCAPTDGETSCAGQFITGFGKRAYRRPLRTDEVERLMKVYETARADSTLHGDFNDGIRLVLTAVLQAPSFLNHIVEGSGPWPSGGGIVPLTPHEVAARISYLLWGTMPDAALFSAADSGTLATREGVEAQAQRLLADGRARPAMARFYRDWLEPEKADQRWASVQAKGETAGFGSDLLSSMRDETAMFTDKVIWEGDGLLSTLMSAPYSFLNATLTKLYRQGSVKGTTLVRVDLNPQQRAGLLTQPSFLALRATAGPVHRGKFVRERLFCQHMPPPPPQIDNSVPKADPTKTTREQLVRFFDRDACRSCHNLMNPIGYGMEKYDGLGRYREVENGKPIDASGEILSTREADGKFDGAPELARRLAASGEVHQCVAQQWLEYATSSFDPAGLECSLQNLQTEFMASGGDLRRLLVAIVKSDAFRFFSVPAKEVCQ